jgi:hypothetical protein
MKLLIIHTSQQYILPYCKSIQECVVINWGFSSKDVCWCVSVVWNEICIATICLPTAHFNIYFHASRGAWKANNLTPSSSQDLTIFWLNKRKPATNCHLLGQEVIQAVTHHAVTNVTFSFKMW